jgi:glycolate oxidase
MSDALVTELSAALSPDRVRSGPLELTLYRRDASLLEGQPGVVCFPCTTEEVQAAMTIARRHGRPVVPRGSGTGLAGGAVPVGADGAEPVVVVTTKMDAILEIDEGARVAWVQPGVLNLDLSRDVAHLGLHFAPDPPTTRAAPTASPTG